MDIPLHDTPSLKLIEAGYGGNQTDALSVSDCMQLLRVSKHLLGFFHQKFSEAAISPGKYSVLLELLALDPTGSMKPSELAKNLGVSRAAITGLIDGLVKQDYVRRSHDETDRRQVSIALTEQGKNFITALLPEQFALMASVMTPLSTTQRGQMRKILTLIEEGLHEN